MAQFSTVPCTYVTCNYSREAMTLFLHPLILGRVDLLWPKECGKSDNGPVPTLSLVLLPGRPVNKPRQPARR